MTSEKPSPLLRRPSTEKERCSTNCGDTTVFCTVSTSGTCHSNNDGQEPCPRTHAESSRLSALSGQPPVLHHNGQDNLVQERVRKLHDFLHNNGQDNLIQALRHQRAATVDAAPVARSTSMSTARVFLCRSPQKKRARLSQTPCGGCGAVQVYDVCVSPYAPTMQHLGASSRRPRHPSPALMAGVTPGRVPVYTALKTHPANPRTEPVDLYRLHCDTCSST